MGKIDQETILAKNGNCMVSQIYYPENGIDKIKCRCEGVPPFSRFLRARAPANGQVVTCSHFATDTLENLNDSSRQPNTMHHPISPQLTAQTPH
jgi:hypothetical protein